MSECQYKCKELIGIYEEILDHIPLFCPYLCKIKMGITIIYGEDSECLPFWQHRGFPVHIAIPLSKAVSSKDRKQHS